MAPLPERLGLLFLALSPVLLVSLTVGGEVAGYLSWLAAFAGLVTLLRVSARKRAAAAGLAVLLTLIGMGVFGASLTLGRGEQTLAVLGSPVLPEDLINLAIFAGPFAAGVFLGLGGVPGAGPLARPGLIVAVLGFVPYTLSHVLSDGWVTILGIPVTGTVFLFTGFAGSLMLCVATVQAAWHAYRDAPGEPPGGEARLA